MTTCIFWLVSGILLALGLWKIIRPWPPQHNDGADPQHADA